MPIVVTGLNVFPVKSCRSARPDRITIDEFGVAGDRRFMLVHGGRFVSQRKCAILATVSAKLIDEGGEQQLLHLSCPGTKDLKLSPSHSGPREEVNLSAIVVHVIDQGDPAAAWFAAILGVGFEHVRLTASAEMIGGFNRVVDHHYLPESLKGKFPSTKFCLSDDGPVSILSHESLSDVNEKMKQRGGRCLPLGRFRMNIEISGCCKAFEEDEWLVIKVGSVPFFVFRNAERCKMTGIDQETGLVDKLGPIEILRSYRAPAGPLHACFGQLLIPLQLGGVINVGDSVTVLERKKASLLPVTK